jgi:hypothetical protein
VEKDLIRFAGGMFLANSPRGGISVYPGSLEPKRCRGFTNRSLREWLAGSGYFEAPSTLRRTMLRRLSLKR